MDQGDHLMNYGGAPQSPLDVKPDTGSLMSPTSPSNSTTPNSYMNNLGFGSPGSVRPVSPSSYPPLSGSKHFCSICGDRASGKHYGVYSCEGCKGFFKRTVRKELTYACRENKDCVIDKRQRNRCQYCRYMKCLNQGMRREAVQEERHRSASGKDKGDNEVEAATGLGDMSIERIKDAEIMSELKDAELPVPLSDGNPDRNRIEETKKKMLNQLFDWAKNIPQFTELSSQDQLTLIRSGWNELLIAAFAFRSTRINDGIILSNGSIITKKIALNAGVGTIFDRILVELVAKMKEMNMDKAELGCLRAIVLFNPDAKGLKNINQVETLREKVYAALEEYCRQQHENEPSRFAKLLLRLPALRSIGLKCLEYLFFYKLIGDKESSPENILEDFITNSLDDPKEMAINNY